MVLQRPGEGAVPERFAHYEKITAHPKVKEVFGEAEFVQEVMTYKAKTA